MQTRKSSISESTTVETAGKDESTEKKLLREIGELRCIIEQCEWNLNTLRFKDVECSTKSHDSETSYFSRPLNVETKLQDDLYRFAGFRCVKFRRGELIFNFMSTNEQTNTHAIQIFLKDGKGNLGKWIMPMSIDMKRILVKTPINELKNLAIFIKNCKHNIDCYIARQKQFLSLKKQISHMKHCTLQSNIGYTQISLELYGVHDNKNDRYINLIIYLLYNSDTARPYKVEIDKIGKDILSNETRQKLKSCLKEFKISDLQSAFDKILVEDNSIFTWMRADSSESPLELNDTNSSNEESFLVQLQLDRKKSLRKMKKRRELQKKWNERKKRRDTLKQIGSSKNNDSSRSTEELLRVESSQMKEKGPTKNESLSTRFQQKKINRNIPEDTTPQIKPKVRLRQMKLNFQNNQTVNSSNQDKTPLFESQLHTKINDKKRKMAKLITSTPLQRSTRGTSRSLSFPEIDNITDIELPSKRITKLNNSKSNSYLDSKNTSEGKIHRLSKSAASVKSSLHITRKNHLIKNTKKDLKIN